MKYFIVCIVAILLLGCNQKTLDKVESIYGYFSLFDRIERNDFNSSKPGEIPFEEEFIRNCRKYLSGIGLKTEIEKYESRKPKIPTQQIDPYYYSHMNVAIDSIKIESDTALVHVRSLRRGDYDKQLFDILSKKEKDELIIIQEKEETLYKQGYLYEGKHPYPVFMTSELYTLKFDKENRIEGISNEILTHFFIPHDPIKFMSKY